MYCAENNNCITQYQGGKGMVWSPLIRCLLLSFAASLWFNANAFAAPPAPSPYTDAGFYAAETGLTPSERAGREIWFKATAGNDRFHTYVFQQRLGVLIDWYR